MYSFCICKWDSELDVYDTVNTTTVVVLFCIFVSLDMLFWFSYKTWVHQYLKKQVKNPSPVQSHAFGRDIPAITMCIELDNGYPQSVDLSYCC